MARLATGILITAKDLATPVFRKLNRGVQNFSTKGQKALKAFSRSIVTINQGWQLAGSIFRVTIGPLVNLLKASAQKAIAFGKAMAEVSTLVDTNAVSMSKLNDVTIALAMEYGRSPIDQAKALYTAISAGASAGAEAVSLMNAANMMAIGGVTEVESAVDGLTSVMNAYGISFLESESVSDKFFQTVKLGKTTATELAVNIGKVTTGAAAAGVSMDEMFAAIAAGTKVGLNTAMVTTGLNAAITAMVAPGNDAKKIAKQMGIEFNAAALESKGLVGVLKEIKASGMATKESLKKLFGSVRAGRVVTALMNNDFREIDKILPQLQKSARATAVAFKKMTKTAGFQVNRLKATFEAAQILLGKLGTESTGFGSLLKGMVDGLKIVVTALSGMSGGMLQSKVDLNDLGKNLVLVGGEMLIMGLNTVAWLTEKFYELATGAQVVSNTFKLFDSGERLRETAEGLGEFQKQIAAAVHQQRNAERYYNGFIRQYGSIEQATLMAGAQLAKYAKQVELAKKGVEAAVAASAKFKEGVAGDMDAVDDYNRSNARAVRTLDSFKLATKQLKESLGKLQKGLSDPEALAKAEAAWAGILKTVNAAQAALAAGDDKPADTKGPAEGAEAASERMIKAYQKQFAAYLQMSTKMGDMDEFLASKRIELIDHATAKDGQDGKKRAQTAIKRAQEAYLAEKKARAKGLQNEREVGEKKKAIAETNAARRLGLQVRTEESERKAAESVANFAAQAGQQIYNLGRGFVTDLMDSTVSAEDAIRNLGASTLTYLAETLVQWTLTEGVKRALIWATVGQKEAADKAKLISGAFTDTAEVANKATALTLTSGMKAKETVGSISMDAAKGQAGALASFAGLGPLGLVLGLAAAAVFAGVIYSLMGSVKPETFARGGLVTGGTTGRDSVRAMLTPGEYVLNKSTVDSIRKGAPPKSPGRYASGGMALASAGSSSPIIFQPIIQTISLPNSVQNQRYYRDTIIRTQQRLNKNGYRG